MDGFIELSKQMPIDKITVKKSNRLYRNYKEYILLSLSGYLCTVGGDCCHKGEEIICLR